MSRRLPTGAVDGAVNAVWTSGEQPTGIHRTTDMSSVRGGRRLHNLCGRFHSTRWDDAPLSPNHSTYYRYWSLNIPEGEKGGIREVPL